MENQLSFGADCVLTLEDIGQFKDYTENIEQLVARMKNPELAVQEWVNELVELTRADPEDIYYLPAFLQLVKVLVGVEWTEIGLPEEILCQLIEFQVLLVEECLLSVTLGEETLGKLVIKCNRYTKIKEFQRALFWMLFRLSDKVVYIEEYQSLSALWSTLHEETCIQISPHDLKLDQIQPSPNYKNIKAAAYLEICEKFARNTKMRQQLTKICDEKWILMSKLAVVNGCLPMLKECKGKLSQANYYGSELLESMFQLWESKVGQ